MNTSLKYILIKRALVPFTRIFIRPSQPDVTSVKVKAIHSNYDRSSIKKLVKSHLFSSNTSVFCTQLKFKSHTSTNEIDSGDQSLDKDSKVIKVNLTSMRLDTVLKAILGSSRNKIEKIFYESKIRVNGRKVMKKSVQIHDGDEIDVVKSISPKNPDHLIVSRVEILNVTASDDSITLTARRFKTLLIENYELSPYKQSSAIDD